MKIKNKKDFGLGVFSILFAAFIAYMSMGLESTGFAGDPGPKMFPLIGSVLMAVCGVLLIVLPGSEEKIFLTRTQWKAAFLIFGMYILFAVLLYLLGFIGAVPVMLFLLTFMLSKLSAKNATVKQRLIKSIVYGVIGGALLYLAYIVGLGAVMPKGLLFTLFK